MLGAALSQSELQKAYAEALPGVGPESANVINAALHPGTLVELNALAVSARSGPKLELVAGAVRQPTIKFGSATQG